LCIISEFLLFAIESLYSKRYRINENNWWLTPVILASREAEIRRIAVQGQPGKIVLETLSQKYPIQNVLTE
jgi:hypothetical protein